MPNHDTDTAAISLFHVHKALGVPWPGSGRGKGAQGRSCCPGCQDYCSCIRDHLSLCLMPGSGAPLGSGAPRNNNRSSWRCQQHLPLSTLNSAAVWSWSLPGRGKLPNHFRLFHLFSFVCKMCVTPVKLEIKHHRSEKKISKHELHQEKPANLSRSKIISHTS